MSIWSWGEPVDEVLGKAMVHFRPGGACLPGGRFRLSMQPAMSLRMSYVGQVRISGGAFNEASVWDSGRTLSIVRIAKCVLGSLWTRVSGPRPARGTAFVAALGRISYAVVLRTRWTPSLWRFWVSSW